MAEQTPDSLSDHEPSMEDILASIRKLIADDDVDDSVDAELPETTVPELKAVEESLPDPRDIDPFDLSGLDAEPSAQNDPLAEMVEFDLTEGESDIDLTTDTAPVTEAENIDDVLDLTEILDSADEEDFVALDIEEENPSLKLDNATAEASSDDDIDLGSLLTDIDVDASDNVATASDDELFDGNLDDLLTDDIELAEPTPTIEPDHVSVDESAAQVRGKSAADTEDMDLVKSLMADLTGSGLEEDMPEADAQADDNALDDLTDELLGGLIGDEEALLAEEAEEQFTVTEDDLASDEQVDLDALLADGGEEDELADLISELSAEADASSDRAQALAHQENDDDILDLTLDDIEETETSQTDDADDEDLLSDLVAELSEDEQEADLTESLTIAGMAAGAAAATAAVSEFADNAEDEEILEDSLSSGMTESDIDNDIVDEDKYMPQIVKADTLTSNEQASGAGGAFASLNKVVEEKAVYAERGPRIGDLVQEALRPMLTEWLDENLEGIVERAVAKEIQRISAGK